MAAPLRARFLQYGSHELVLMTSSARIRQASLYSQNGRLSATVTRVNFCRMEFWHTTAPSIANCSFTRSLSQTSRLGREAETRLFDGLGFVCGRVAPHLRLTRRLRGIAPGILLIEPHELCIQLRLSCAKSARTLEKRLCRDSEKFCRICSPIGVQ